MSWFQNIDLLGIEPKLYYQVYYQGAERYKTKKGAFITSLSGVVILFLSGYFILNFLQKSQTSVLSYSDGDFYPLHSISENLYFINLLITMMFLLILESQLCYHC
jgi:hypothetical protein